MSSGRLLSVDEFCDYGWYLISPVYIMQEGSGRKTPQATTDDQREGPRS